MRPEQKNYQVTLEGSYSFYTTSASKAASVASDWKRRGGEPRLYAVFPDDRTVEVPFTTSKETSKALAAAK